MQVPAAHLQLVAAAAMLISTKFDEILPPDLNAIRASTVNLYTAEEVFFLCISALMQMCCGPVMSVLRSICLLSYRRMGLNQTWKTVP